MRTVFAKPNSIRRYQTFIKNPTQNFTTYLNMCLNNSELCPFKLNFEPRITKKMENKPILRLQDLVSSNGFKPMPSPVFINYSKIKCKGCQYEYPNEAIMRHLFTYYKCNEYYQKNPEFKKELDKILKERNLEDTSKIPKPQHNLPMDCRCVSNNTEICYNCEL